MAESKLNRFLDNLDKKILECSICQNRFTEPKSLNCLHSFCQDCLQSWVKTNGSLTCPICVKAYPIPEGGIQNLQPNTFLNNLLEIVEQVEKDEEMECSICRKGKKTDYYCIQCRLYLCSSCGDCHLNFPESAKHKLYSKEEIIAMSPQRLAALHPPRCSQHNEDLKFYCKGCKIPICRDCAITDHNIGKGNHSTCNISESFNEFRETADKLKESANVYKNKVEVCHNQVLQNYSLLDESKETSLRDIGNSCEALVKIIKDKEEEMKKEVERLYIEKKKVSETQIHELQAIMADVNTKLNFLDQLLESNPGTAMESSETVIKALNECIHKSPKLKPADNGEIKFESKTAKIKKIKLGIVTEKEKAIDWLETKITRWFENMLIKLFQVHNAQSIIKAKQY